MSSIVVILSPRQQVCTPEGNVILTYVISRSPTGKFATMGPYAGNKVFEMACLYWFNKKDQTLDKRINSRQVKVVTRSGIVTKERKGNLS